MTCVCGATLTGAFCTSCGRPAPVAATPTPAAPAPTWTPPQSTPWTNAPTTPQPPSPQPWSIAPAQSSSSTYSIIAFVLSGFAVFLLPILFGPAAIILAAVGKGKGERLAVAALAVSIVCTIVGFILGAIVWTALSY